jgi:short-subunit dehydrogenase
MKLTGKVAVITGASRGIGRATAIALARSGCRLLLTALESDELESLVSYLNDDYQAVVGSMPADLTDESKRKRFVEWIGMQQSPPDILINNAGGGRFGRFEGMDNEDLEQTIKLNIHLMVFLSRELIPVLRTRPQAKIVNISSGIARLPYPGLAVYGAAKGFISSLSESLACELAGTNVSVLCFHPGLTETSFMASAGMDMSKIPKFLIRSPESVASRIVKAIKKDRRWVYGDIWTRLGVYGALSLPQKLKSSILNTFFWKLPDAP